MIRQKRIRRMTPHRADYLTAHSEDAASRTLRYVDKKAADPYPTDYADLGVNLLGLSVSGVRITDVYAGTVGHHL